MLSADGYIPARVVDGTQLEKKLGKPVLQHVNAIAIE
jgi:hypothetical protein